MSKIKLIKALKAVIAGLQGGTLQYKWSNLNTCNCGVVAQALTGETQEDLFSKYIEPLIVSLKNKSEELKKKHTGSAPTWQELVRAYCPVTGEPTVKIFKVLFDAGMTRNDIWHLEGLSDKRILKRANISTAEIPIFGNAKITIQKKVQCSGIFGWLLGMKKTVTDYSAVGRIQTGSKQYYESKKNLLKYLSAWIEILEGVEATGIYMDSEGDTEGKNPYRGSIVIGDKEYRFKSREELENLKRVFAEKQEYVSAAKVRDLIEKIEKGK